jgi:Histidine kinase-, DNA gyrase B-, and HSP90-like ATPase/Response regulator receiver domain
MKLERIPYEPLSVVEGALAAVRGSGEEKGLNLSLQWSKEIPFRILGDPNRLRQILLNLLSNSIKFTATGGICVTAAKVLLETTTAQSESSSDPSPSPASEHHPMVKFVVQDTGIGIEEEHLGRIFTDYYQGDVSVARTHGGTGLGLSICKLLVSRMGGTIGVESEYGKGSSFWFCLPADVPVDCKSPEPAASDQCKSVVTHGTRLNVLIAEDNQVNQKLLKRMLERMGHHADVAENGKEAIQKIESHREKEGGGYFDVVLMDIQMPVIDGLEAT